MHKIETFTTEEEVRERIEQLKSEGVDENQVTLVANRDLDAGGAFGDYSGVKTKSSEGGAWDKVVSFFSGDEPEDQVINDMELTASEEQEYRDALASNKILLYVDERSTVEGESAGLGGGPGAGAAGAAGATGVGPAGASDAAGGAGLGAAGMAGGINPAADRDERDFADRDRDETDLTGGNLADRDRVGRNRDVTSDEESLKLREERLNVDKENVKTGEVDIDKHVETDHQEFDVPVEREEVTIERRPVDGESRAGDADLTEGDDSVRIPINEERVNVDKENVVSEEVVVKKDKVRDTEHVSEDVRREEVDVDETTRDNRGDTTRRDDRI